MSLIKKIKFYFLANFPSHDFAYVLYPFLRIYKIFGFAPIKLEYSGIFCKIGEKFEWHVASCIWTFFAVSTYIVGFFVGVHHLWRMVNFSSNQEPTAIVHIATWLQIVAIFILGAMALLTSWIHMSDTQQLCGLIFKIDRLLKGIAITNNKIDYQHLRKQMFLQFSIQLAIGFPLSMVNCTVIQPDMDLISVLSCYWFICFAPIMLVGFKEFQFYNLMWILKSKIDIINEKLQMFVAVTSSGEKELRKFILVHKLESTPEIPLAAVAPAVENSSSPHTTRQADVEGLSVESLQKLLEIYSCITDGIELIMKIFAWHLLIFTVISFGIITVESYNLFALIMHSLKMQTYQIVIIIAWILAQVTSIGINVSVCSITSKTMSTTISLLHKLKSPTNLDSEACLFYQILQVFSSEILQRKHNFTAAGFFDINYKLITSIVGAVTTYLVIIIQFHLTNIPNCHYNKPETYLGPNQSTSI